MGDSRSTVEGTEAVPRFRIEDTDLEAPLKVGGGDSFVIQSSPRPYRVEFCSEVPIADAVRSVLARSDHPVVLADERVLALHADLRSVLDGLPVMSVGATEEFKDIDGSLRVLAFMDDNKMTRSSSLVVLGGGIIQDVGAFAACVYKRGVPWSYIPTTLLAQADSCMGAKSGLNFRGAKNLLGVFSAPRHVMVHTGLLASLAPEDLMSGLGEIFRLCATGGRAFLERFEEMELDALSGDARVTTQLIETALSVKRAVVEYDEFELNIRRAMNFGHSVGHSFEALSGHAIPHGTAVAVGVLVESDLSHRRGGLSEDELMHLVRLGAPLIGDQVRGIIREIPLENLVSVLQRDKKTEGSILKLAVIEHFGQIRFIDLPLGDETVPLLKESLSRTLERLDD